MNGSTAWIGERPTASEPGVVLLVGVCGAMMAGLQPLLLMGAASACAGGRWKPDAT